MQTYIYSNDHHGDGDDDDDGDDDQVVRWVDDHDACACVHEPCTVVIMNMIISFIIIMIITSNVFFFFWLLLCFVAYVENSIFSQNFKISFTRQNFHNNFINIGVKHLDSALTRARSSQ